MGVEIFSNYVLCGIREGEGSINNSIGVYSFSPNLLIWGNNVICPKAQKNQS